MSDGQKWLSENSEYWSNRKTAILDTDIFLEKDPKLIREAWAVLEEEENQELIWALYESGWITISELRELVYRARFSDYVSILVLLAGFTLAINGEEI